uniref:7TM_GPCR_Srx domain-containing protein n=1 Tax=Caenorhabditis tropicalis TaxID=1561998 RepID=A0A1I7U2P7_9PELO
MRLYHALILLSASIIQCLPKKNWKLTTIFLISSILLSIIGSYFLIDRQEVLRYMFILQSSSAYDILEEVGH